uniref:Sulfotransferase domain-containing protein n=1 Tax=Plectus sambesii TaxID=2011161 RepID=A0A914UUH2_9BILA
MAPERIYHMNESIKLILIVRNPVIRTISDFTQVHYTKQAKNKTQIPFASVAFSKSGLLLENYKPVRNSLYSKHLLRWLKYFPLDQILIVDGDHFISEPLAELRRVERFLHLEHEIHSSQMYFNRTKGFFCFRHADGKPPKCLGETKGRSHVEIGEAAENNLRRQFAPYNEKFFSLIGHRFDW